MVSASWTRLFFIFCQIFGIFEDFSKFCIAYPYSIFSRTKKKTVHVVRKTICRYYYGEAVGGIFTKVFFLVDSNMVNLLSFSVLSSVWVVCFDLWLFDKNSSFGRANCFYWSKSWHFWSRCGFLVTTTLLRLLHFDRKNKTKIQSQQFLKGVSL